jgi:hypothetical protein
MEQFKCKASYEHYTLMEYERENKKRSVWLPPSSYCLLLSVFDKNNVKNTIFVRCNGELSDIEMCPIWKGEEKKNKNIL